MTLARCLRACDGAVDLITARWTEKTSTDGVTRTYVPPINLTEDVDPPHEGRQIYVFPRPYEASLITRDDQQRSYAIRVLMVERYTGDDDRPPKEWIDERVTFFEQGVFNLLANQSTVLIDEMSPALDETAAIGVLYDEKLLLQHQAFWTWADFPFAEDTDLNGEVQL